MQRQIDWSDPAARARLAERLGPLEYNKAVVQHLKATTAATIAGHRIRPVTTRFGRLYAVGNTDRAFKTFELAIQFATDNPA